MRILIACEYSGTVRRAFAANGHTVMSCDLLPADDGSPDHYQGDVLDILHDGWDLMIAHPPCTYLSVSGMHWTTRGLRDPQLTEDALEFVNTLLTAPIPKIALENPISVISTRIRKPDQIIQPWMFGDNASKKTCLWLKGLPRLVPRLDKIIPPKGWQKIVWAYDLPDCPDCGEPFCPEHLKHYDECDCIGPTEDEVTIKTIDGIDFGTRLDPAPKPVWANQTPSGQNKLGPSDDRWKIRSETYNGIAAAMAEQWGTV